MIKKCFKKGRGVCSVRGVPYDLTYIWTPKVKLVKATRIDRTVVTRG